MRIWNLLTGTLLLALFGAAQQPARTITRAGRVDALFAGYGDSPGAVVVVVRDGNPELVRGYGLADVQAKTPITAETAFDLASLTKQFTAAAILVLVQQGKLSLSDPLAKWCREFSGDATGITIRQLLNHTSGLQDYVGLFVAKRGDFDAQPSWTEPEEDEPTSADALRLIASQDALEFTPGSKFEYSNSGYVVLGQIVERASGMRLAEFLDREVFKKLGMTRTGLVDERRQPVLRRAHSYLRKSDTTDVDYTPLNRIYGDGNVNTTAADMVKWLAPLGGNSVLSAESRKMSWTPPALTGGEVSDYGFGWVIGEHDGETEVSHEGGWVGFETAIAYFPRRRLGVVVLSNFADMPASELTEQIADIYWDEAP